jgi:hypothetical protein
MQNDIQLFSLSGAALFVVLMSWLDEGWNWLYHKSAADSRVPHSPFGLWWSQAGNDTGRDGNG